jgi:gamma-glutamylcyclotransferase (GGCT)/AIG2-like uncharacterized protein YtfP
MTTTDCPYADPECLGDPNVSEWLCFDCEDDWSQAWDAHRDPAGETPAGFGWVFVYGTLMDGEGNDDMMPSTRIGPIGGRARAEMFYVSGRSGYPVVVPTERDEWVHGELWRVPFDSHAWMAVVSMEVGAGYDVRWTEVVRQDNGTPQTALMFTWPWQDKGERIASGNWRRRFQRA